MTIVPAAYAGGDDHDNDNGDHDHGYNKNKAEDNSAAAIADCDDNDVERAGFDCLGIAVNDIDLDLGGGQDMVTALTGLGSEESTGAHKPETLCSLRQALGVSPFFLCLLQTFYHFIKPWTWGLG